MLLSSNFELQRSVASLSFYYKVKDGMHFYLLVHVDDYASAYLNPKCFDVYLAPI